jgi:predicted RNase H-like nuclease
VSSLACFTNGDGRWCAVPDEAPEVSARLSEQADALARLLATTGGAGRDGVTEAYASLASTVRQLGDLLGVDVERALAAVPPPPPAGPRPLPPLEVTVPVLGVDACKAGWVGAILEPGAPRPRIAVASTIGDLVETVRRSLGIQAVAIDIPIGLPDDTTRAADSLARKALRGKASSVFTTLTRAAYAEPSRDAADPVNRALTGQGVGTQAFGLRAKILEVDAWVRSRPTVLVLEAHPELSFAEMAGAPIRAGKKTAEGQAARLTALRAAGLASPSVLSGTGYAADDVLDACAAAWTAARRTNGAAHPLPDPPQTFSDGIPAAIWV